MLPVGATAACGRCLLRVGGVGCMWALPAACGRCLLPVGAACCLWALPGLI